MYRCVSHSKKSTVFGRNILIPNARRCSYCAGSVSPGSPLPAPATILKMNSLLHLTQVQGTITKFDVIIRSRKRLWGINYTMCYTVTDREFVCHLSPSSLLGRLKLGGPLLRWRKVQPTILSAISQIHSNWPQGFYDSRDSDTRAEQGSLLKASKVKFKQWIV